MNKIFTPSAEQVREWRATAYQYADKQNGDYNEADELAQEKFAELATQWGAAQEREACAKVCDAIQASNEDRGQWLWEAKNCAEGIRKRSAT